MNLIATVIKHCTTGIDGESYDVARVLLLIGGLAFVLYSGYMVWKTGLFDPQNYGIGLGGLLGGGGAAIGLKRETEPGMK